jgi:hypothetical protein
MGVVGLIGSGMLAKQKLDSCLLLLLPLQLLLD